MSSFRINVNGVKTQSKVLNNTSVKLNQYAGDIGSIKDSLDEGLSEMQGALEAIQTKTTTSAKKIMSLSTASDRIAATYEKACDSVTENMSIIGQGAASGAQGSASVGVAKTSEQELKEGLEESREEYLTAHNDEDPETKEIHEEQAKIDSDIDDDLQFVLDHDEIIEEVAKRYGLDKAMIQALLFHEQTFIGSDDGLADLAYMLGITSGVTTGCGQISIATAQDALAWYEQQCQNGNSPFEGTRFAEMLPMSDAQLFDYLQDDANSIDMMGLVLRYKAATNVHYLPVYDAEGNVKEYIKYSKPIEVGPDMSEDDIMELLGDYNGNNNADRVVMAYREAALRNYKLFKEYNEG